MNDFSEIYKDLDRILLTKEQIRQRVAELGAQISRDFKDDPPILICILKGACVFFSDLMREINLPVAIEFMAVSSYGSSTKSSGVVRIVKDLDRDIVGRNVLVVEDIVDSGMTLSHLKVILEARKAKKVSIVTLLDKPERRRAPLTVDYSGFVIPDAFVVGYGLDYDERYRNLPDIGILSPRIYGDN